MENKRFVFVRSLKANDFENQVNRWMDKGFIPIKAGVRIDQTGSIGTREPDVFWMMLIRE